MPKIQRDTKDLHKAAVVFVYRPVDSARIIKSFHVQKWSDISNDQSDIPRKKAAKKKKEKIRGEEEVKRSRMKKDNKKGREKKKEERCSHPNKRRERVKEGGGGEEYRKQLDKNHSLGLNPVH